jgi:hypothetical protein
MVAGLLWRVLARLRGLAACADDSLDGNHATGESWIDGTSIADLGRVARVTVKLSPAQLGELGRTRAVHHLATTRELPPIELDELVDEATPVDDRRRTGKRTRRLRVYNFKPLDRPR